jgi:hypothetical protein
MVYTDDIGDLMGCYDGYDGPTNEPDYAPSLYELDDWWRHNGIWDREEICQNYGILYEDFDGEQQIFLEVTDEWWEELTAAQKLQVYEDFFAEV